MGFYEGGPIISILWGFFRGGFTTLLFLGVFLGFSWFLLHSFFLGFFRGGFLGVVGYPVVCCIK